MSYGSGNLNEMIPQQVVKQAAINPRDNLPVINTNVTQQRIALEQTIGTATGNNELRRSNIFRNKPQLEALRQFLRENTGSISILNIGVGNGEEATVYAGILLAANRLDSAKIQFSDIVSREDVKPRFNLGFNILGQPLPIPPSDVVAYCKEPSGEWRASDEVQHFIQHEMDCDDNFFDTGIEQLCRTVEPQSYAVVTCNNVAQYLGLSSIQYDNPHYKQHGDFRSFQSVILSVAELVQPNGLLFIDAGRMANLRGGAYSNQFFVEQYLHEGSNFGSIFTPISKKYGIYRRVSADPIRMSE